jgi:hypothetical protein
MRPILLTLVVSAILAASAVAQDTDGGGFGAPPPGELRSIQIEHMHVAQFWNAMRGLIQGDARVAVDERTNRLLVVGSPDVHGQIAKLVTIYDVPGEPEADDDESVRVFALQHVDAAEVQGSLARLFPDPSQMRMALDPRGNQIIVQGEEMVIERFAALLAMLDVVSAEPESSRRQLTIRLVWLISSAAGDIGRSVPPDLAPVVDELERIGIVDVRLAAQTLARTTSGATFTTESLVDLDDRWEVRFEGHPATQPDGTHKLELVISGATRRPIQAPGARTARGVTDTIGVITTVWTPADRFVVLGISPNGATESIFVLQVRED